MEAATCSAAAICTAKADADVEGNLGVVKFRQRCSFMPSVMPQRPMSG